MSEAWREGLGLVADLTMIDTESLRRDLEATRARLAEAEWALAHLQPDGSVLDERLRDMVASARAEALEIRERARQQAEQLVIEAERLRLMAEQAAQGGTEHARKEIARKVTDMVSNADQLRINAERQAAEIIAHARESVSPQLNRIEDLEAQIAEAEAKLGAIDTELRDARRQADSIVRNARLEADARVEELTERARQRLEAARIEAERIVSAAQERAGRFS